MTIRLYRAALEGAALPARRATRVDPIPALRQEQPSEASRAAR